MSVEFAEAPVNLLATNGKVLLAYRSGDPVLYRLFEGIEECRRCRLGGEYGRFAPVVESHRRFKGICVTSRPFGTPEKWTEISSGNVLAVTSSLGVGLLPQKP